MRTLCVLAGVTASGKTGIALELASHYPIEIINADSLLVYKGLDIGTAKPTAEERARVAHHLIDVRSPDESFTAKDFIDGVHQAIREITDRKKIPLIVGGTGFYLKALLHGLWDAPETEPDFRATLEGRSDSALHEELARQDPATAGQIAPSDRYRIIRALEILRGGGDSPHTLASRAKLSEPDPQFKLLILDRPQDELLSRIQKRTRHMLEGGFVSEVERLLRVHSKDSRPLQAVGYREVVAYLDGAKPPGRKVIDGLAGLQEEIDLATRQLVKKQRTWFKGQHPYAQWFTLERDRTALFKTLEAHLS